MLKFKITCPKCGVVVATSFPDALIWERCPGCRVHVWERYDVLMADIYCPEKADLGIHGVHADN